MLPTVARLPGLGQLVVNAFVLHGEEPVLVDAGVVSERDDGDVRAPRPAESPFHDGSRTRSVEIGVEEPPRDAREALSE